MKEENIFDILKKYNLGTSDYHLYEEYSKTINDEKEIAEKIKNYNKYIENNDNKYSEEIMQYLRQREGLEKYDYSQDKKLNKLSPNQVFSEIVRWNGLLGGYEDTIKHWIKEIYGIDLNLINNVEEL
ncbi:TPA: hypothetical protein N2D16_002825 [Clostridium botulinum]|nr:hypothetical protein [Clostridium botulinum]